MKKSIYFIFCLVAMATLCAASCEKEPEDNPSGNESSYAELIVGTWLVDNMTFNGEQMTPENIRIIMNEDGTGLLNDNGVTENNGFSWSLDGSQLTIVTRHDTQLFTINNLTKEECTFSGTSVPGMDNMQGESVIHMVKVK